MKQCWVRHIPWTLFLSLVVGTERIFFSFCLKCPSFIIVIAKTYMNTDKVLQIRFCTVYVWVLLAIHQHGNKCLMTLTFFANLLTILPSDFGYIGNLAYPTHRSSCFTQRAHISFQICLVFNDQWFSTHSLHTKYFSFT